MGSDGGGGDGFWCRRAYATHSVPPVAVTKTSVANDTHGVIAASVQTEESVKKKNWVCKECKKAFLSKGTLQRHLLTRHAIQKEEGNETEKCLQDQICHTNALLSLYLDDLKKYRSALKQALRQTHQSRAREREARSTTTWLGTVGRDHPSPSGNKGKERKAEIKNGTQQSDELQKTSCSSASPEKEKYIRGGMPEGVLSECHHSSTASRHSTISEKQLGTGISHWVGIGVVRGNVRRGHFHGHLQQHAKYARPTAGPLLSSSSSSAEASLSSCSLSFGPPLPPSPPLPTVLEVLVETHAYHERAPGQMTLHRQRIPVRCVIETEEAVDEVEHDDENNINYSNNISGHSLHRRAATNAENGMKKEWESEQSRKKSARSSALFSVVEHLGEGDVVLVRGQYGLHASFDLISKRVVENVVVEADAVTVLQRAVLSHPPTPSPLSPSTEGKQKENSAEVRNL